MQIAPSRRARTSAAFRISHCRQKFRLEDVETVELREQIGGRIRGGTQGVRRDGNVPRWRRSAGRRRNRGCTSGGSPPRAFWGPLRWRRGKKRETAGTGLRASKALPSGTVKTCQGSTLEDNPTPLSLCHRAWSNRPSYASVLCEIQEKKKSLKRVCQVGEAGPILRSNGRRVVEVSGGPLEDRSREDQREAWQFPSQAVRLPAAPSACRMS
jgi:hypothetical protein